MVEGLVRFDERRRFSLHQCILKLLVLAGALSLSLRDVEEYKLFAEV
jgi:hypothetical protein